MTQAFPSFSSQPACSCRKGLPCSACLFNVEQQSLVRLHERELPRQHDIKQAAPLGPDEAQEGVDGVPRVASDQGDAQPARPQHGQQLQQALLHRDQLCGLRLDLQDGAHGVGDVLGRGGLKDSEEVALRDS